MTGVAPDYIHFPGLFLSADARRWVDRMEGGARALESLFGISLDHAFVGTKRNMAQKKIDNRRKYFEARLKTRNRWFSLYSGSTPGRDYFNFGGKMYGGEDRYAIALSLPPQSPDRHEHLLVTLGDALQAQCAQVDPLAFWSRMRAAHWNAFSDTRAPLADRTAAEQRLPLIRESAYTGLGPLQPHHIGWLNYWSAEVCDEVGFPANAAGLDALRHSYRTPGGAWLVKLSESPPRAGDEAYVGRLADWYQRFPRVGIRGSAAA